MMIIICGGEVSHFSPLMARSHRGIGIAGITVALVHEDTPSAVICGRVLFMHTLNHTINVSSKHT